MSAPQNRSWLEEVSRRAGIDLSPDPIEARRVTTVDGAELLVIGPLTAPAEPQPAVDREARTALTDLIEAMLQRPPQKIRTADDIPHLELSQADIDSALEAFGPAEAAESLDEAWKAAEAALPAEGPRELRLGTVVSGGKGYWADGWHAGMPSTWGYHGYGDTPAAALLALTEALRGRDG